MVDTGIVFPIPEVIFRDHALPRIQPLTNKCKQFRLVITFGLLQTVQRFSSGIKTARCHVSGCNKHTSDVIISSGLGKYFLCFLNRFGPEPTDSEFPHPCTCFFMPYQSSVSINRSALKLNKAVQIFVYCSLINQVTHPIAACKLDCTLSSLIRIQIETKFKQGGITNN